MFGIDSIDKFEESLINDKRNKLDKKSAKKYVKDFLKASKSPNINKEMQNLNDKYKSYFSSNTCYLADFSFRDWGAKQLQNLGENKFGKLFVKDAQKITRQFPDGTLKTKHGILNSGKTLRRYPFAIGAAGAGLLGTKYAYDKYQQYKPEITMLKAYDKFKTRMGF